MPKDMLRIRATLKLRNDVMLSAREKAGLTQSALGKATGVPQMAVSDLERLYYKRKRTLEHAIKIAEYLGLELDDVLPAGADYAVPSDVVRKKHVHVSQMMAICNTQVQRMTLPAPDKVVEDKELSYVVDQMMDTITYREREIVQKRCEGYTIEELGHRFKITRERVRQIEAKALRKLRHPTSSRRVERALGIDKDV